MPSVILTRALAERLFPRQSAIGEAIYVVGQGAADRRRRRSIGSRGPNDGNGAELDRVRDDRCRSACRTRSAALPAARRPGAARPRCSPRPRRRSTRSTASAHHPRAADVRRDPHATTSSRTARWRACWSACRSRCSSITALGIVGLASFWVAAAHAPDRHPPRARRDARRHPALLPDRELHPRDASASCSAWRSPYAINLWLMQQYELRAAAGEFLPIGARRCCGCSASSRCSARRCAPRRSRRRSRRAACSRRYARCPRVLVIDDNPAVATALEVLFSLHDIRTLARRLAGGRARACSRASASTS